MATLFEKLNMAPSSVTSILVVCTANICRSPMAKGVVSAELKKAGLGHIRVDSAGIIGMEGEPASGGSVRVCDEIGIDIHAHESSALTGDKVEKASLILVMERAHVRKIGKRFPDAKHKTALLGAFLHMDQDAEIDDPIGRADIFYQHALFKIQRSAEGLIRWLSETKDRSLVMKKSFGAKPMAFPTPVWVVGTYDDRNTPNAMTAAWAGICCSSPPCICVSLRKATYSHGNIVARKAFTISIPSEEHVKQADLFGIVSGKTTDKFAATGLTPVKSETVDAPYVGEFPVVLECRLIQTHEIGLHTQFIGEIMDVKVDESCLDEDGKPDMGRIRPILFAPEIRNYHGTGGVLGKAFSIGRDIG